MKYTDTELERLLDKLVASTRSPRGKYSAHAGYPQLEKLLKPRRSRLGLRLYPIRSFAVATAAVALLCLSVWTAYLYMQQPASILTVSTLAEIREVRLPDGTSVMLNHFSSLSYPEKFKGDNREVSLNGEAYFEVTKDRKHPFIVTAEAIDVQVLGTHFNIEAYRNNSEIRTTLLEGSVAVSNKKHSERIVLQPNEMAIYNKVERTLIRQPLQKTMNAIAWSRGEFIFEQQPLKEIARTLSNSFGVEIQIPDSTLKEYRITARFSTDESLPHILSLLQEAGHFQYSQNKKLITLKPRI